jgi:hypothetical protein
MEKVTIIGVDLAKSVFQLHGAAVLAIEDRRFAEHWG